MQDDNECDIEIIEIRYVFDAICPEVMSSRNCDQIRK
jgi:hypothetical protein